MATKVTTRVITADAITSALVADDIALGGNPTTTTQSAGNDTTRVATTAFVTGAISDLTDSAPSTLNTLNELAAALNDDASFSTTVTNSIATKVPLAGGTMSGNLVVNAIVDADNFQINGAQGSDGQVLTSTGSGVAWEAVSGGVAGITTSADGTAITIDSSENVTFAGKAFFGGMTLTGTNAGRIGLNRNPADGTHTSSSSYQRYQINGPSSDGDYLQFQNYDSSGNYTGGFRIDDGAIRAAPLGVANPSYAFDNDTDTGMTRPTGDTIQLVTGGTSRLRIASDGKVGIGCIPEDMLDIQGGTYDTIRIGSNKTDNTNKTAGICAGMYTNNTVSLFQVFNQNGNNALYYGSADGAHRGLQNHYWYVNAGYNATSDHRLAMQINSSGGVLMKSSHQGDTIGNLNVSSQFGSSPNTSENALIIVQNGGQKIQIMAWAGLGARIGTRTSGWNSNSGGDCYLTGQDTTCLVLKSSGTAYLANGSTAVTSDERLKKNISNMSDGQLEKINALTVRNFEWKDDRRPGPQTGLIAQEVESVIADAIEETAFAPDPDDTSRDFDGDVKIVKYGDIQMRLLKAVQELSAELEAAKARITTLEG